MPHWQSAKMEYFGLKLGQDLENLAAHPYQTFRGVPPPPRVLRVDGWGAPLFSSLFSSLFSHQNVILQYSFQTCFLETIAVSVNQSNVHTKLVKHLPQCIGDQNGSAQKLHTPFWLIPGNYASVNSSSAHPPPPGNSGAFSRTFHPGVGH